MSIETTLLDLLDINNSLKMINVEKILIGGGNIDNKFDLKKTLKLLNDLELVVTECLKEALFLDNKTAGDIANNSSLRRIYYKIITDPYYICNLNQLSITFTILFLKYRYLLEQINTRLIKDISKKVRNNIVIFLYNNKLVYNRNFDVGNSFHNDIDEIIENDQYLYVNYYKTYECISSLKTNIVTVSDKRDDPRQRFENIDINIGVPYIITELGFFKEGFEFRFNYYNRVFTVYEITGLFKEIGSLDYNIPGRIDQFIFDNSNKYAKKIIYAL